MRQLITILTLIVISDCFGQDKSTNQLTSDNLKTGKWVYHYDNGTISSIKFYKTEKRKISEAELFEYNNKLRKGHVNNDSIVHEEINIRQWTNFWPNGAIKETLLFDNRGRLKISDDYEYNDDGKLRAISRLKTENNERTFIIGNKDSIEFNSIDFHLLASVYKLSEIKTKVKNLTDKVVQITLQPNLPLQIKAHSLKLNPLDSAELFIPLTLPTGQFKEKLQINSKEWSLDLEVIGYGYHVNIEDFKSKDKKALPTTFYYCKSDDEYQMEIEDIKSKHRLTFIPISKQIVKVDLKPGTYTITIAGTTKRLTKTIEIND